MQLSCFSELEKGNFPLSSFHLFPKHAFLDTSGFLTLSLKSSPLLLFPGGFLFAEPPCLTQNAWLSVSSVFLLQAAARIYSLPTLEIFF